MTNVSESAQRFIEAINAMMPLHIYDALIHPLAGPVRTGGGSSASSHFSSIGVIHKICLSAAINLNQKKQKKNMVDLLQSRSAENEWDV